MLTFARRMKVRCKVEGRSVQSAGAASPCGPRPPPASSPSAGCHDASRGGRHGQALATPCRDETHLQHKEEGGELYPPAFPTVLVGNARYDPPPPPGAPPLTRGEPSLRCRCPADRRGASEGRATTRTATGAGALRRLPLRRSGWWRERRGRHPPRRRQRAAGRVTALPRSAWAGAAAGGAAAVGAHAHCHCWRAAAWRPRCGALFSSRSALFASYHP